MKPQLESYKVKDWVVFGRNTFKPPFKISDALINEARIVHVVHGNTRLISAHQYVGLTSGDTLIMKADNFVNNWKENENGEMSQVIVFQLTSDFLHHLYDGQLPNWFLNKGTAAEEPVVKADHNPMVSAYFQGLASYLDNPKHLTEELIQIKIRELISLLVQTDDSKNIRIIFGDLFNAREYNFKQVIQQNLFEDLNIEELAFLTSMSLSSFKRKFNAVFGTSPNKYIVSKRLEKAQKLLSTTQLSIAEIAYDCGFSDVGYFSKTFRKYYNSSPSELRKTALD